MTFVFVKVYTGTVQQKHKKMIRAATLLQTVIGFALVTLFVIAVANYSINKALSQELEDTKRLLRSTSNLQTIG